MKKKTIILILSIFIMTNILAQECLFENINSQKDSFLSIEFSETGDNFDGSYLRNKNDVQGQATTLKSENSNNQKRDSIIYKNWNFTKNEWAFERKVEYKYDYHGNRTQDINFTWNDSTNKWLYSLKGETTFDSNNVATLYRTYSWDKGNEQWVNYGKSELAFNTEMKQFRYYKWDNNINDWIRFKEIDYILDGNGKEVSGVTYSWHTINNQWINDTKDERKYNSHGLTTQLINYELDTTKNQWIYLSKWEYCYDSNEYFQTQIHIYIWDKNFNDWLFLSKYENSTNSIGRTTSTTGYTRKTINDPWTIKSKTEYLYDSIGHLIQEMNFDKNDSGLLFGHWKSEFSYDTYGNRKIKIDYILNTSNNVWDNSKMETNYYSEFILNTIPNISITSATIFPNPFSSDISIKLGANYKIVDFELFDINGRKVMSKQIANGDKVNLEALKKGVYFYNFPTNIKTQRGKLIKK